ncbi:MAG: hypothetical protein AAB403_13725, partial [Planctomycetota bacterium]
MASRWLRAVLTTPLPDSPEAETLRLTQVALKAKAEGLTPDLLFTNSTLVDGSKEYLPFGETPKVGDAFYVACHDAFSNPGATLKLEVEVEPSAPTVTWEHSSGPNQWTELPHDMLSDGTGSFTHGGIIELVPPSGIERTSVGDVDAFWFRLRISSGTYRGAPLVQRFQLTSQTSLAQDVGPDSITVTTPNFADKDAVLKVGDEFVQVTEKRATEFKVAPPFLQRHDKGAVVQTRDISTPVARLTMEAKGGQKTLVIAREPPPRYLGRTLMIDDEATRREFIGVRYLRPIAPGGPQWYLGIADPLRFDHQDALTLRTVTDFLGFAGSQPVNFARPFYPFSEQPSPANLFFFGTAEGFPPKLTIQVDLEMAPPKVDLAWEFLGASGWQDLKVIPDHDTTKKLIQDGQINLQLPKDKSIIEAEVNGRRNYWIRTRIKSGNYGVPSELVPLDPADPSKGFKIKPGTGGLSPPVIRKLRVDYEAARLCQVVTQNGFYFTNQTSANVNGFAPFCSVKDLPTPVHNE